MLQRIQRRIGRYLRPQGDVVSHSTAQQLAPGTLVFRCNVCSAACAIDTALLEREEAHCPHCDCNMRYRGLVHCLSVRLFGRSLAIDAFPASARDLRGIGMSDSDKYALRLSTAFQYVNTFYHKEPRLDIGNIPARWVGANDFVVSSDVFEHVAPPVAPAFANLRRLLKPGGLLVLTVPFSLDADTVEHFPELHDYEVRRDGESPTLVNRTIDGRVQTFSNLVFHGGPGSTLEMRLFSEAALRRDLAAAGFEDITFHREAAFEFGVYWKYPWSVPVTATSPR